MPLSPPPAAQEAWEERMVATVGVVVAAVCTRVRVSVRGKGVPVMTALAALCMDRQMLDRVHPAEGRHRGVAEPSTPPQPSPAPGTTVAAVQLAVNTLPRDMAPGETARRRSW